MTTTAIAIASTATTVTGATIAAIGVPFGVSAKIHLSVNGYAVYGSSFVMHML